MAPYFATALILAAIVTVPVHVGIRVASIGRSSVRYEIGVFRIDEDVASAEGYFVHVFVERGAQKPVRIPDEARAKLQLIAANSSNLYTQSGTGLQWLYNDLYYKSGTPFDNYGLLFSFGSSVVGNIYSIGSQLYLSLSNPIADYNPGVQISMTVSQTPLPPALPLFFTAIIGLWFLLSRKKAPARALL